MAKKNKFDRKRGHSEAIGDKNKKRRISFSIQYLDNTQGQSLKEWEAEGLLADLMLKTQQISQHTVEESLRLEYIKQYTKVAFPPTSKFKEPKHITPDNWAVIHIKPNSKEVVAGFLENDVFYIVFLDKNHEFWDTDLQDRNKNRK
ncbi:hypothetical protein [Capnocytophaga gingivalis]|uniref:hypothetical protein n=1 Tax=Capnocytophaga gingivalis TaxID=1017 RepID=UPI0023521EF4|nr:hypothetical protein [Capnocytophaga gingivalis]